MRPFLFGLAAALATGCASGPSPVVFTPPLADTPGQHAYTAVVSVRGEGLPETRETLNVLVYLPRDYGRDPGRRWPLLLSLHGSYQIGTEVGALYEEGLPPLLDRDPDYPFVVLSPQLPPGMPSGEEWLDVLDGLAGLVETAAQRYAVDRRRIVVTGFSMGGFGTWQLALAYPGLFAALVPVAGGYRYLSEEVPAGLSALKNVPVWAFHSRDETVVPAWQTTSLVDALGGHGGHPKLTLYPSADHTEAWARAYADPLVLKWMLEQRRE